MLFTDESHFIFQSDSRRVYIWREASTQYRPGNIRERYSYTGGSILVWGGVSVGGCTDLYVLPGGTLNTQRYRDDILDPIIRRYADAIGDTFILQAGNALILFASWNHTLKYKLLSKWNGLHFLLTLIPFWVCGIILGEVFLASNPSQNLRGLRAALCQQRACYP